MIEGTEKECPHCLKTKELEDFYRVKSRSGGRASWCKTCSNTNRKRHKSSGMKRQYQVVYQKVIKEGKPSDCPCCGSTGVPSHKMRGRIEDGDVKWSCVECRTATLVASRQVLWGCSWCNEERKVSLSDARKVFCGRACTSAWRSARKIRRTANSKSPPPGLLDV